MSEATMTGNPPRQKLSPISGPIDKTVIASLAKFGIATVLVLLYYLQIIKPDADARREAERATANAVIETNVTQRMIVEQLRRGEESEAKRDVVMQELQRTSQEQTSILRQIMIDQKQGVWQQK